MVKIMISLENIKIVTVKVGTSTLTHKNGTLNFNRLEKLVRVLSDIKNRGISVILVTSGAIGVGMTRLGLKKKPQITREKQAAAAVGQSSLMSLYDKLFLEYGHTVAQVLLTRDVVENNIRKENVSNTFKTLIDYDVIPIVNENDTVSTDEIEFGDNDTLSAVVAQLTNSNLLILLSDIDGLYDKDPKSNADAKLISEVKEINDTIKANAGGAGSERGTGGMQTKLIAAEIATSNGIEMIIANGEEPEILYDIFDGKQVGTVFLARKD